MTLNKLPPRVLPKHGDTVRMKLLPGSFINVRETDEYAEGMLLKLRDDEWAFISDYAGCRSLTHSYELPRAYDRALGGKPRKYRGGWWCCQPVWLEGEGVLMGACSGMIVLGVYSNSVILPCGYPLRSSKLKQPAGTEGGV